MSHAIAFILLTLLAGPLLPGGEGVRSPEKPLAEKPAGDDPLEGLWSVAGRTQGIEGSEYTGTVQITRMGDGYALLIAAVVPAADGFNWAQVTGVGLRHGNVLAVSYKMGDRAGLSLWQIGKDGQSMSGRWTQFPGDRAGIESLKFLGKAAKPPAGT